jgi:cytochrome c551/c552
VTPEPEATPAPATTPGAETTPEAEAATGNAATEDAATEDAAPASILPPGFEQSLAAADPIRGQQLTLSNACIGCHAMDPNQVMPGPTWNKMAVTAATRVEGQTATEYLYTSIIHPNDYVVEGFMTNVMLQTYEQTLSQADLADIIAYLLSLK